MSEHLLFYTRFFHLVFLDLRGGSESGEEALGYSYSADGHGRGSGCSLPSAALPALGRAACASCSTQEELLKAKYVQEAEALVARVNANRRVLRTNMNPKLINSRSSGLTSVFPSSNAGWPSKALAEHEKS